MISAQQPQQVQTLELGPSIGATAPEFALPDHDNARRSLTDILGKNGLLLGFTGDIWTPAGVRRIMWLQRHAGHFIAKGVNVALVTRAEPTTLFGFTVSSAVPINFPMLSDPEQKTHALYAMTDLAGLVLMDSNRHVHEKWLMTDERVWPKVQELSRALYALL